jgi:hypothetical protein
MEVLRLMLATEKYLMIPVPRMTQNLYRGLIGAHTRHTSPVSIRWTPDDRVYIERMAYKLDLSFSEFVRWTAFYAAKEIERIDREETFKLKKPKPKVQPDLSEYE